MSTTQHSQGIENLRTLYSIMRGVPEHTLRLYSWRSENISNKLLIDEAKKVSHCGFTACAVGWACAYPEFNKQGLRFRYQAPAFKRDGKETVNWVAVGDFFDVTLEESRFLFTSFGHKLDNDPGWKESPVSSDKYKVLHRIRHLLMRKGVITRQRYDELANEELADQRAAWSPA